MKLAEYRNIGKRLAELSKQGHKVEFTQKITRFSVYEVKDVITVLVDGKLFGDFVGMREQQTISAYKYALGIKRIEVNQ